MKSKILLIILSVLAVAAVIITLNQFVFNEDKRRNVDIAGFQTQEHAKSYKTIGIVVHNMQHMFMANVASLLKEKAKENENIKILIYDSEGNNDKQISQLEELIGLKVDGIILNPNDKDLVDKGIEKVKEAGIPVVTVNMNVSSNLVDCYIGSNSIQAGGFQGEFVAAKLKGSGNIAVLAGQKGQDATADRLNGLKKVIDRYPGLKIIEVQYGGWDRNRGYEIMKDIIARHNKIDAVVSQNDEMLLGALTVLDRYGMKPVTIGVDAIPEALEAIKDGRLDATVYQNGKAQAVGAYETMMKIFKGQHIEKVKWIPYEMVTSENIDNYINQNFILSK